MFLTSHNALQLGSHLYMISRCSSETVRMVAGHITVPLQPSSTIVFLSACVSAPCVRNATSFVLFQNIKYGRILLTGEIQKAENYVIFERNTSAHIKYYSYVRNRNKFVKYV